MSLTTQQITQIRAAAGMPPTPQPPTNTVSLAKRLGIDNAAPPASPESGFIGNVKEDLANRGQQVQESYTRQLQGKQSGLGTALDTAGATAGGIWDIAGEGIKSVNNSLGGLPGKVLTDLPGPINTAKQLAQSPVGQETISKATEAYNALKEAHPAGVQHFESLFNLAMLAPIGAGAKVGGAVGGEALQTTGKALQASAKSSIEKSVADYASELVRPETSKAVRTSEVGRTTEKGFGPFKSSIVAPTYSEAKSAEEVAKIPGINPRATLQQNFNVIKDYNTKLSETLKADLAKNDFIFPKKELMSRLNVVKQTLAENPSLVGDSAKTAEKLVNQFQKLVNDAPAKGSSLLQVRKEFDRLVESQKGSKVFDPKNETAFTIALREIRQAANSFLDEKATNVAVKDSLHQQSALFNAMDNIAPKAATEANTAFQRALQRVGEVIGTKNRLVQGVAAAVGVGGLGAASMFAPIVAGIGVPTYLLYRGGKLLLRPEVRNAVGKLLEGVGNTINPADRTLLRNAYNGVLGVSSSEKEGQSSLGALRDRPLDNQSMTMKSQTAPKTTSNISPSVSPSNESVKGNPEAGFIANPFAKSPIERSISNHVISSRQVLDTMDAKTFQENGGMSALLERTKTNIVDGLKAEGNIDAANNISKLETKQFANPESFGEAAIKTTKNITQK